jgi:hypothetical protein
MFLAEWSKETTVEDEKYVCSSQKIGKMHNPPLVIGQGKIRGGGSEFDFRHVGNPFPTKQFGNLIPYLPWQQHRSLHGNYT